MIQQILDNGKDTFFTTENIGKTHEGNDMIVYCISHKGNQGIDTIPIAFLTGSLEQHFIITKGHIMLGNHYLFPWLFLLY